MAKRGKKRKPLKKLWQDVQSHWTYKTARWFAVKSYKGSIWVFSFLPDAKVDNRPFMVKHRVLATVIDSTVSSGHNWMDRRDTRAGVLTPEEYAEFEKIGDPGGLENVEEWREWLLKSRRDQRKRQLRANRTSRKPLTHVVATSSTTTGHQQTGTVNPNSGFRPPKSRTSQPLKKASVHRKPNKRSFSARKPDRATQLRGAWGAKWNNVKGNAVSHDPNLAAAIAQLNAFADNIPQDREQLHAYLGSFAALGEAVARAAERFQAGLEAQRPDGSPGVPTEVTSHLSPIQDAGQIISTACQDTSNAFEDRFALAIKVAQDEEAMSSEYLKKQPA